MYIFCSSGLHRRNVFFFTRIYLVLAALRSLTSIMAKFREATIKCNSEIPDFTIATGADKYKTI